MYVRSNRCPPQGRAVDAQCSGQGSEKVREGNDGVEDGSPDPRRVDTSRASPLPDRRTAGRGESSSVLQSCFPDRKRRRVPGVAASLRGYAACGPWPPSRTRGSRSRPSPARGLELCCGIHGFAANRDVSWRVPWLHMSCASWNA
jgi:hypothetical protein